MSIEVNDNGNNQPQRSNAMSEALSRADQARQPQGASSMDQNQQPQQQSRRTGFSFRTTGRLLHTQIARTPMSEVLTKLEKKFTEIYQPYGDDLLIKLIPFDVATEPAISASLLVVAAQLKNSGTDLVTFHTLILDGTGGEYQSRFEQWQGANIEILRVATDLWDKKLSDFVTEEVRQAFGTSSTVEMESCVVPRDFNIEDEGLVRMLAANALIACNTELEHDLPGFADLNLDDAQNDSILSTKVLFNDAPTFTIVGQPVRADISVKMSAAGNQNSQNPDRVTDVAGITGFLDLAWAPVAPVNAPFANFGQQMPQQSRALYAAQFIITNMECAQLQTAPAQLLALVQALMLRQDNMWAMGFRPRPHTGGIDIHNIGALGYEAAIEVDENGHGKIIDTKSDRFKPETFAALLQMLIQPGLTVSQDINESGPDTWYNGFIMHAAKGSKSANQEIIRAANVLTGGRFEKRYKEFNGTGTVVDAKSGRSHLGKWRNEKGDVRDIRDIGYVEVLNMTGDKDLSIIRDWSDSWFAQNIPVQVREATRKKILVKLCGDPDFTGFAVRCTYEAAFLNALAASCSDAGLSLRPQVPYSDFTTHERATAQFAGSMLSGMPVSNLFAGGGYANNNNQGGIRGGNYGRWGA